MAQPFHRFDDGEGSRSVAERFVIVSKTKLSPVYRQRSVVTFHVANIVTMIPKEDEYVQCSFGQAKEQELKKKQPEYIRAV